MLILIDNYDSFTYNLVHELGRLNVAPRVFRNDKITVEELAQLAPERLVISPGPGAPRDAGISCDAIRHFAGRIPILGVCLGHQCIAEVFGGRVVPSPAPRHGKTSPILHTGVGLFAGIPNRFAATRYHSLIVDRDAFPACLEITARTADGVIMALAHRTHAIFGVQFHPEAILTAHGLNLLENFLRVREVSGA